MKFLKEKNETKNIDDMTIDELIDLAKETIRHVSEEELNDDEIEIWSKSVLSS